MHDDAGGRKAELGNDDQLSLGQLPRLRSHKAGVPLPDWKKGRGLGPQPHGHGVCEKPAERFFHCGPLLILNILGYNSIVHGRVRHVLACQYAPVHDQAVDFGRLPFCILGSQMATWVFYVDESGDVHGHATPIRNGETPIFTLSAVALPLSEWRNYDREYLYTKRRFLEPEITCSSK